MSDTSRICPDCEGTEELGRRDFLKVGATTAGGLLLGTTAAQAAPTPKSKSETLVKKLYESMTDTQKKSVCFKWDHVAKGRGLLRTHVSNNWQITKPQIRGNFFTKDQQEIMRAIFEGLFNPAWVKKFDKQLRDDTGGKAWGAGQSIAIFGEPGKGNFELVMTGRHMTVRADGNSEKHVALGGPIFHGHAAQGFNEKPDHPGNIFWHQALEANKVYKMLDGKQRKLALERRRPGESSVAFRGKKGEFPGIPVSELSKDQVGALEKVLMSLVEPYRKEDKAEVLASLKAQGGLDACSLAFYRDGDLGDDGVWDNWRLEGPAFVWYFRGAPHVHIWINVASDPSVKLNARG